MTDEPPDAAPDDSPAPHAGGDDDTPAHDPEHDAGTLTFTVDAEGAGSRLDAFLAARVAHASRSRLKGLIDAGEVLVSGQAAKPSHRLRAGEQVELEPPAPPVSGFAPEEIPLNIVYEDDSVVVVNKPAGLVMHPAAGVPSGTLANALAFHFRQLPERGGAERPGIVHRLDRDTSGLVVVARNEEAHESLAAQFLAREVTKYYVALVHGATREERGRVEEPIGRDPQNRTRMAVVRGGRAAVSLYRVRRAYGRFTLLDVQIKTGRTHQIRVHLAHVKHPVVGDRVYGAGRDQQITDARLRASVERLGRQFLHAERLGFRHPRTGEFVKFAAPLPADLQALLDLLVTP